MLVLPLMPRKHSGNVDESQFDVVIIDFEIGGGAWHDILVSVRNAHKDLNPRLVGLISKGFSQSQPELFQAGFNHVFTLPLNPRDLINSLK